jgi:hypothetical protein
LSFSPLLGENVHILKVSLRAQFKYMTNVCFIIGASHVSPGALALHL